MKKFNIGDYVMKNKIVGISLISILLVFNIIYLIGTSANIELVIGNIEIIFLFILLYLSVKSVKIVYILSVVFCSLIFFIYIAELYSLIYTGAYIPAIGFDNIESIDFIFNKKNIIIILIVLCVICLFAILIYTKTNSAYISKKNTYRYLTVIVIYILFTLTCYNHNIYSPLSSFIYESLLSINGTNVTYKDFYDNETSVIKENIYTSNIKFSKKIKHPNIIILIPDGIPARLISNYIKLWEKDTQFDLTFNNLTPNINKFMEDSTVIDDYYNNLAATYPGLYGMFTSVYPYQNASPGYIKKVRDGIMEKPNVASLFEILHFEGYNSYFIDGNNGRPSVSFMLENMLGVHNVYNTTNISKIANVNHFSTRSYILDQDIFLGMKNLLQQNQDEPKIIVSYFLGTHLGFNPSTGIEGKIYGDGTNVFLSQMYNFDYDFGEFMRWFEQSEYKENTIIILTTDHTHFPDNEYKDLIQQNKVLSKDFVPCFYDKIPFIIYSKDVIKLPKYFNVNGRTSLDFAPTILHILGIKNYRNSFMGTSLFEPTSNENLSGNIYSAIFYRDNGTLNKIGLPLEKNSPEKYLKMIDKIKLYMKLQEENTLFDGKYK